jgi:NodT family efflux transporter outer membrane factor (OMF) lipoprotein
MRNEHARLFPRRIDARSSRRQHQQALPTTTTVPPRWNAGSGANPVTNDWLQSFNDPRMQAVVGEAIANNLNLRQAAARVEEARQNVVVAGAALKPQVNAFLGASSTVATTRGTDQGKRYDSSLGYAIISWEADIWGQLRAQQAASEAGYEATALDYAYARQSLAATAAKSWYLAVESRQLLSLAEENVKLYARLLNLVQQRRSAGRVADLDVDEASYSLNSAKSQFQAAQGEYAKARRILELLLGRFPAAEIEIARDCAPLPPPVPAGLPSSLLERRPDIVAAEREVLAAFRNHEAAELALLPSFVFTLDGGRLSDNLLSVLKLNPWLVHGSIGVSIPIYHGGALQAQVAIATAEQQRAVAKYGSVALTAFGDVENGLAYEGVWAERLKFDQRALANITQAVRVVGEKYQAGAIDLLSVLEIQTRQILSESDVIKARNAQLANHIDLHLALGGSFDASPATPPLP